MGMETRSPSLQPANEHGPDEGQGAQLINALICPLASGEDPTALASEEALGPFYLAIPW